MQGLLNVQFWLWGQDALRADFEARGFSKTSNPTGRGSSLYRRGNLTLHSASFWLETAQGVWVYSRPKDQFYWLESAQSIPTIPATAVVLPYPEGFDQFEQYLLEHEHWIVQRYGNTDRPKLLQKLPPNARKARGVWQEWFDVRIKSENSGQ